MGAKWLIKQMDPGESSLSLSSIFISFFAVLAFFFPGVRACVRSCVRARARYAGSIVPS